MAIMEILHWFPIYGEEPALEASKNAILFS